MNTPSAVTVNQKAHIIVLNRLEAVAQYNNSRPGTNFGSANFKPNLTPLSLNEQATAIVSALQERGLLKDEVGNND